MIKANPVFLPMNLSFGGTASLRSTLSLSRKFAMQNVQIEGTRGQYQSQKCLSVRLKFIYFSN